MFGSTTTSEFELSPPAGNTRFPNLFIIGASKAGSSALHAYLDLHPHIAMSSEKEPCFFVDQEELRTAWPIMARNPCSHDREAYLALWQGKQDAAFWGESSVYYSQSPHRSGVPASISSATPDARIIYIVREPVTRAISHYWQRVQQFQETLPIEDAMRQHSIYRDTSDYALQLNQYLRHFDRDRIHIVIAENLRSDRVKTVQECIEWLGLPAFDFDPSQLSERHVSGASSRRPRLPFITAARNSSAWAAARKRLPVHIIDKLRRYSTTSFDKKSFDDRAARQYLTEYFKPRRAEFEQLIGRSIDAWPAP
jgi:Sulfotransferase domain.